MRGTDSQVRAAVLAALILGALGVVAVLIQVVAAMVQKESTPPTESPVSRSASVHFTQIPPTGDETHPEATLAGLVVGTESPQQFRVVIFSLTDKWYVQPSDTESLTVIHPDGSWSNSIHLGKDYAALLVKPSYNPPSVADALPQGGPEIIAVAKSGTLSN